MPIGLTGSALQDALNKLPRSANYLGTIDCTTVSKNNSTATTIFNDGTTNTTTLAGKVLLVQNAGTVDVRIATGSTAAAAVSNSRGANFGVAIGAGERVTFSMGADGWLAAIATSTTANLDVWEIA